MLHRSLACTFGLAENFCLLKPLIGVSLPPVYILYRLPLICPHCASVPLIGFKNLPPNRHNFVILPLTGARFVILFLIGTCCVILLLIDTHFVILFLIGTRCVILLLIGTRVVIMLLIGAALSS